jgi:hypothetical protein
MPGKALMVQEFGQVGPIRQAEDDPQVIAMWLHGQPIQGLWLPSNLRAGKDSCFDNCWKFQQSAFVLILIKLIS